jgi:hypothetical protein
MEQKKPASGWVAPKDDAVAPKRRSPRRDVALLTLTIVVLGWAAVVLSGVVNG